MEQKLAFRFKDYHDVFNVQLGKRFFDCHKIDLISEGKILFSFISNYKSGIIYTGDQQLPVKIISKTTLFSAIKFEVFLHGDFFCKYTIGKTQHVIRLSSGRTIFVYASHAKMSFKTQEINYELEEGQEPLAKLTATRNWDYSLEPKMEYNGGITFRDTLSNMELLFALHLILLDCAFSDPKNS